MQLFKYKIGVILCISSNLNLPPSRKQITLSNNNKYHCVYVHMYVCIIHTYIFIFWILNFQKILQSLSKMSVYGSSSLLHFHYPFHRAVQLACLCLSLLVWARQVFSITRLTKRTHRQPDNAQTQQQQGHWNYYISLLQSGKYQDDKWRKPMTYN